MGGRAKPGKPGHDAELIALPTWVSVKGITDVHTVPWPHDQEKGSVLIRPAQDLLAPERGRSFHYGSPAAE